MTREIYESDVIRPDEKKLVGSISLMIEEKYVLTVFIWPDVGSMRSHTITNGDHRAIFVHPEIVVKNGKVKSKDVGYIHLVQDDFGAGTLAHELQHFLQTWIMVKDYDPVGNDWEEIAYLAGDLTKDFWNNYFEMFDADTGLRQ